MNTRLPLSLTEHETPLAADSCPWQASTAGEIAGGDLARWCLLPSETGAKGAGGASTGEAMLGTTSISHNTSETYQDCNGRINSGSGVGIPPQHGTGCFETPSDSCCGSRADRKRAERANLGPAERYNEDDDDARRAYVGREAKSGAVTVIGVNDRAGLAGAVEIFAHCLEATACRRGESAAFSHNVAGGTPLHRADGSRTLPVEVLRAVRVANNIGEVTRGPRTDGMATRNAHGDDKTGEAGDGRRDDAGNTCYMRGTPVENSARSATSISRSPVLGFRERGGDIDTARHKGRVSSTTSQRLYGFDSDGQSVKDAAAVGGQGSKASKLVSKTRWIP